MVIVLAATAGVEVILTPKHHHPVEVAVLLQPQASQSDINAIVRDLSADPAVKSFRLKTLAQSQMFKEIVASGPSLLPCFLPNCGPPPTNDISYFLVVPNDQQGVAQLGSRLSNLAGVLRVAPSRSG